MAIFIAKPWYAKRGKTYQGIWVPKTWSGSSVPNYGTNIWTDGNTIYYSQGYNSIYNQLVYNKDTKLFSIKSWNNGFESDIYGEQIWHDGDNTYLSRPNPNNRQKQFNKNTKTWSDKTWSGTQQPNGSDIWSDGENIYYTNYYVGYQNISWVLDKDNSEWKRKTWSNIPGNHLTPLYIWKNGERIYYSSTNGTVSYQYELNKDTSTWNSISWKGYNRINASGIWTDGIDIYYSNGQYQKVLDRTDNRRWLDKQWDGFTYLFGGGVWTDGDAIYYSNGTDQYELT